MCGIVGVLSSEGLLDEGLMSDMLQTISHRGPDYQGIELMDLSSCRVGFGHSRLSILDLSVNGHQPKTSEDNRYVIIHNGEIYNYKEIKKTLINKGYGFSSNSDTEVILNAFIEWGPDCVQQFIGMFAFSILDKQEQQVYVFRDRAGVKPLYYYRRQNVLLFSSELKAIAKHPNFNKDVSSESLSLFLKYGYIPEPHCIYRKTQKLKPGHYLQVNLTSMAVSENKYWDVLDYYNLPKKSCREEDILPEIESLLKSACEYRMVSDVPVGVFLSSGYDSTAVAALLSQRNHHLKTFTIGFEGGAFNEAPIAKQIAGILGTDHTEYYCTEKDALTIIPLLSTIYDEPFADSSAIPTTLVSQIARQHVTVSLSADGGDEVFGGYPKYNNRLWMERLLFNCRHILKAPLDGVIRVLSDSAPQKLLNIRDIVGLNNEIEIARRRVAGVYMSDLILKELLLNEPAGAISTRFDDFNLVDPVFNDILDMMLAIDYKTYMVDDILHKVDRATMSVSLEGREPLLDHRLIEFMAQVPSKLKFKNGQLKYLLKKIVHQYVPAEIMNRPKKGFGIPFDAWFNGPLSDQLAHYFSESFNKKLGFFKFEQVDMLLNEFRTHSNSFTQQRVWNIFIFNQWAEKWL